MMMKQNYLLPKQTITQAFNQAAARYDDVANLQRRVADGLLQQLSHLNLIVDRALEVGTGTGYLTAGLSKALPDAQLLGIDIAERMIKKTAGKMSQQDSCYCVCADTDLLPLIDASVDLVVSNLALQWCSDLLNTFNEYQRVLMSKGQLLFTTFGPGTLNELRASWACVDDDVHVNNFVDIDTIKSALRVSGFVVDDLTVEPVKLFYSDVTNLMGRLKLLGAHNINQGRARGLTGKYKFKKMIDAYESYRESEIPASYEVIYVRASKVNG